MRIYSLDFLKGFMALGILLIHTGSFIITPDNLSDFDSYIYAMTSLFVPVFFIISGYFFAKSRSIEKATANTIITYLLYMGMIVAIDVGFDILLHGASSATPYLSEIVLYHGGLGYFWFVNCLIYFMTFYILMNKIIRLDFDKLFWLIIIIFSFNVMYYLSTDSSVLYQTMDFVYYTVGFIIAKIKFLDNIRVSRWYLILLVIYPLTVGLTYDAYGVSTLCFALLLFVVIKSLTLKENVFCFYSKYSLLLLFVHYYVIAFLNKVNIVIYTGTHYILNFLVVLLITVIIVHLIDVILKACRNLTDKCKIKLYGTKFD